jgi:hypothetical protein
MASTTFVDKTTPAVAAAWLNDVNALTYTLFNGITATPVVGKIVRSNGTNLVASTFTIPDTFGINTIVVALSANTLSGLAPVNNAVLTTSAGGVPTWTAAGLPITYGGTGQITANASFNALAPTTTKGDLIVSTGVANVRQPVGTNTQVIVADSTQTNGIKWFTPTQTRQIFTSGTALTYTTPAGVTRINVRLIGGGGGGAAAASNNGTTGNNTTFSTLTGGGGGGGQSGSSANAIGGVGGTATGGDINIPGAQGTAGESLALAGYNSTGGTGGSGCFGGAGGGGNALAGTNGATNSGGGGGGGGGAANVAGGGGGSGGYCEKLFISPAATYIYTVGAFSAGGVAGVTNGGNGAAGLIIVDEYYT